MKQCQIGFISAFALSMTACFTTPARADVQSVTIRGDVRVFGGDTLEIGPMLIRLHGVDAPEKAQRCTTQSGETWNCGAEASAFLFELIDGEQITCDALDRDPYGRVISRCEVDGLDIGSALIENGLAWAFIEYSDEYVVLETAVKEQLVGVWQTETQTPWAFRDDKWNRALASAPDGKCPIKGNISPDKEKRKVYHTPWSPNYGNTKIDETKGERWLCNEAQALGAGWQAVAGR